MIDTKKENKAIDQNSYKALTFSKTIGLCGLCSTIKENEPLIKPCECMGELQFVHFDCLQSDVSQTQKDSCLVCNAKYTGVGIKKVHLGFCTYVCSNSEAFTTALCGSLVFSFLFYIIYLAVIDFVMSDGIIDETLRIILIVPTVIYAALFTIMAFLCIAAFFHHYYEWRENNYRIVLTPNNSNGTHNQTFKLSSFQSNVTQNQRVRKENNLQNVLAESFAQQNNSKGLQTNGKQIDTKNPVVIRSNSASDKSMQASKDTKNEKEVKFEDKTKTLSVLTQTKNENQIEKTKGNALYSNSGIEYNFLASNP